jgi:nickel-dependent lactate racemase
MIYYSKGSETDSLSRADLQKGLYLALDQLGIRKKVLAIPPDITRFHSQAGILTELVYKYYQLNLTDILPALGTHAPMSKREILKMFGKLPLELFRVHDWRRDILTLGAVDSEIVAGITENLVNFSWPVQLNKLIWEGRHDLILSIGQVVPHEVIGMANYNKNILIGTGGAESLNKSHFIGAVYGLEKLMGHKDNPVRKLLNYAADHYLADLPIVYIHTVIGMNTEGEPTTRGLFIGDDEEVFNLAAQLSGKINITYPDQALQKVVVYLDPSEYKSTWLGNKAIYRTRMALADNAELIILAPGLKEFGEDHEIDRLIRKYGYIGTKSVLEAVANNTDLKNNLSAAAHLIHGSTEGRFSVTYCPGNLTRSEIESVNYRFAPLREMMLSYNPSTLKEGFNCMESGEMIYYISNPALGLWSDEKRFNLNN